MRRSRTRGSLTTSHTGNGEHSCEQDAQPGQGSADIRDADFEVATPKLLIKQFVQHSSAHACGSNIVDD